MTDVTINRRRLTLLICIALAAVTLAVYAQVKDHAFIDFDDEEYIVANPHVRSGLKLDNIVWAFTEAHSNNWHPLTWISHMVDAELFGMRPAGHHLVNVLLHTMNAILLFLLLQRMTGGALWPSAFTAALFALHPLHVESVAWAAERKDVLSTCFWILTLWMYLRYTQRPSRPRYAMILLCLAMGLMAKQMLVTLPFVLLLLDYWPLGRLDPDGTATAKSDPRRRQPHPHPNPPPEGEGKYRSSPPEGMEKYRSSSPEGMGKYRSSSPEGMGKYRSSSPEGKGRYSAASLHQGGGKNKVPPPSRGRSCPDSSPPPSRGRLGGGWGLFVEKIPLFLLAALAAATVFLVQLKSGVLYDLQPFPLQVRLENGLVSYVAYIGKMFWPVRLAVFYPHPLHAIPWWQVLGALGILLAVTYLAWHYRRKRYLLVGWLWYLGTLVPVIGLVQVGVQAMADRYTYIPLIGLFIMVAWGLADLFRNRPYRLPVLAAGAAVILLLCAGLTWKQIGTWQDREKLYTHAARVVPANYWAYNNLGAAVANRGNLDEAMAYIEKSLEIMPTYPGANKNMAVALYTKGRFPEAVPYIQKALRFQPRNPEYHLILGLTLMKLGNMREAVASIQEALRLDPAYADAREALQEALNKSRDRP